jgi:hypothetical protein
MKAKIKPLNLLSESDEVANISEIYLLHHFFNKLMQPESCKLNPKVLFLQ